MLIAASADGPDLTSAVSMNFETCRFLLLIETDTMNVEVFENNGPDKMAETIVARDCEAVITGKFQIETFNILADACITRYSGYGFSVGEAMALMDGNTLGYIRYADENDTCHGDHSGETHDHGISCNCEEHD